MSYDGLFCYTIADFFSPVPKDAIRATLEDLGLTDKEAAMYLLLLQLGTSAASTLADRAEIPRSTAQFTCQQLTKRGLLRMVQKANTYLFTAEPPEKLDMLLRRERDALEEKSHQLHRIIGELKAMQNPYTVLPKVQFYEGKEGVEELYDKILEMKQPIDSFEDKGEMFAFIPKKVEHFIAARIRHGIHNRVICPSATPINKDDPAAFRQVRTVPLEEFPFSCDIKICGPQVSIFSFKENTAVGIAIRHEEIADNFRLLFNQMWALLDERGKNRSGKTQS